MDAGVRRRRRVRRGASRRAGERPERRRRRRPKRDQRRRRRLGRAGRNRRVHPADGARVRHGRGGSGVSGRGRAGRRDARAGYETERLGRGFPKPVGRGGGLAAAVHLAPSRRERNRERVHEREFGGARPRGHDRRDRIFARPSAGRRLAAGGRAAERVRNARHRRRNRIAGGRNRRRGERGAVEPSRERGQPEGGSERPLHATLGGSRASQNDIERVRRHMDGESARRLLASERLGAEKPAASEPDAARARVSVARARGR